MDKLNWIGKQAIRSRLIPAMIRSALAPTAPTF
jgi:hypothetical protein